MFLILWMLTSPSFTFGGDGQGGMVSGPMLIMELFHRKLGRSTTFIPITGSVAEAHGDFPAVVTS